MGDSSDGGSASDSQWSDSLIGDSLTGATLGDGYPSTWKSVRIKKGEAPETPLSSHMSPASQLLCNLKGQFSTSRKNTERGIFKRVWMDEDELGGGESTKEGEEEEGQYKYFYETRFSRDSVFRANIDEYSLRRTVLPVREGRGGKKNRIGDDAKNGTKLDGRKITREVNPRTGRTSQAGGEAKEERGNILLENAWMGMKLGEEGASFGGGPFGSSPFGSGPFGSSPFGNAPFGNAPFGGTPFGGGPFRSDPYLCYPLQLCSWDSKERRSIAKEPYKVLSAPNLVDDFYLNL
ncbi:cell division cycle protein 20 homolog, partial [Plasmodium cynomolgi strain B]